MTNRDLFHFLLGCAHRALEVATLGVNDHSVDSLWTVFYQHNKDCLDAAEVVYDPCNVSIRYL